MVQQCMYKEYVINNAIPIGISEYGLPRILPENLKSTLPSIEEIETELWKKEK